MWRQNISLAGVPTFHGSWLYELCADHSVTGSVRTTVRDSLRKCCLCVKVFKPRTPTNLVSWTRGP